MADDPRIQMIRHTKAFGPSAARNSGFDRACGDWLVLLDADDCMEPDRIERLIAEAEARNLDALADNLQLFDTNAGQSLGVALDPNLMAISGYLSLTDLLKADWPGRRDGFRNVGICKPILRRSFLTRTSVRYDEDVRLGEDLLFYAQLLLQGGRFGLTPRPSYVYAVRANSISYRTKPTTELVGVNAKIQGQVAQHFPQATAVLALLANREAALRFQVLKWAIKVGNARYVLMMLGDLGLFRLLGLCWMRWVRKSEVPFDNVENMVTFQAGLSASRQV